VLVAIEVYISPFCQQRFLVKKFSTKPVRATSKVGTLFGEKLEDSYEETAKTTVQDKVASKAELGNQGQKISCLFGARLIIRDLYAKQLQA